MIIECYSLILKIPQRGSLIWAKYGKCKHLSMYNMADPLMDFMP